jgi:hypothetical protein
MVRLYFVPTRLSPLVHVAYRMLYDLTAIDERIRADRGDRPSHDPLNRWRDARIATEYKRFIAQARGAGHNKIRCREKTTIKRRVDLASHDVGNHPGRRRLITKEKAP